MAEAEATFRNSEQPFWGNTLWQLGKPTLHSVSLATEVLWLACEVQSSWDQLVFSWCYKCFSVPYHLPSILDKCRLAKQRGIVDDLIQFPGSHTSFWIREVEARHDTSNLIVPRVVKLRLSR